MCNDAVSCFYCKYFDVGYAYFDNEGQPVENYICTHTPERNDIEDLSKPCEHFESLLLG